MTEPDLLALSSATSGAAQYVADPATPKRTWLLGNLRTGRIHATVPVVPGARTVQTLNRPADLTAGLALFDPDVAATAPWVSAAPAVSFLACDIDGAIVDAGPIWGHAWNERAQVLRLAAAGLWSLFDHRLVVPVLADLNTAAGASTTLTKATLAAIARGLVEQATAHVGGSLPLVLPADAPGAAHTRTWAGYELAQVGAQLRALTEVENGPDLDFRPRYAEGDLTRIEWVLTPGSPKLVQAGPDWVWDLGVTEGPVVDLDVGVDGSGLVTRGWVVGEGAGTEMKIAARDDSTLTGQGYPLLEAVDQRKTTTEATTLAGRAAQLVAANDRPVLSLQLTLRANDSQVTQAAVGDWARVLIPREHRYLPGGTYRSRITKITRADEENVTVALTPIETP